jgi:serine/threonine protein kinase
MQLLTPETRLNRFKLVSFLGRGGMGEVWKAEDELLGREVAIKILPPELANPDLKIRFEREYKILAALNHPGIAHLYEAGEEYAQIPDTPRGPSKISFLVMEYIEGKSLSSILNSGALPVVTSIRIGRQISKALSAAHEAGIVHRDLKPANIMVTSRNIVKILDFGLARPITQHVHTKGPSLPEVTTSGMVLGTAAYLAPEQIKGDQADVRSDIWAFGCVMYQMLSGQRPFPQDSIPEVLASVLRDDPVDLSTLNSSVPAALKSLIEKCLDKEAENRPHEAKEISAALKDLLQELRQGPPSSPSIVPEAVVQLSATAEMLNRFLRMVNPAFPQLTANEGKVGFVEIDHHGAKIGILVVPKTGGDQVAFVAPIFRLPEGDSSRVYSKLLSLCNGHTDVGRFSIDNETRTVNLTCVRNCASLESRQFRHTLDAISTAYHKLATPLIQEYGKA